jgi:FkbM family methyltransferase
MFFTGEYEIQELVSLKQVLRPGDVVVEFGAGCGVVSTFIAKRIGPSGRLTTYEANADLMPSITALASANNVKFDVEYVAVGVMDGSTTFFRNRQILSSSILDRKDQLAGERITVPVKGLSGIIERHKPTVLVMDVEGAETSLLTTVMPASVRAVVLEMHPHIIGDKLVSGICAKLIESGFNLSIEFSHEKNLAFVR